MFWLRELAGWLLLGLGVFAFGVAYFQWIRVGRVFPAGPVVLMGIFLFRGGIHLLKVAVAARLCQQPEPKRPRPAVSARLR
jgi:hypothetical protein